jgi:hypothetical protein
MRSFSKFIPIILKTLVFAAMDKSSGSTYPVCICNDCMDQTQKHK